MASINKLYPIFADWRARPGRSPEWRENKRNNFPSEDMFVREYPEKPADLFRAAEELVFPHWAITLAQAGASGPMPPEPGHTYIKYWDIGRMQDAVVGVTFDITQAPYQLVNYVRKVRSPYPVTQKDIEDTHKVYQGLTYIEDNGAGMAVIENLKVQANGFNVNTSTKVKIILALKVGMERGYIKFNNKQLIAECSGYMWDDKGIVQDSVMAAAGAVYCAGVPAEFGNISFGPESGGADSRLAGISSMSPSNNSSSRFASVPGSIRSGNRRSSDEYGQRAEDYV